ncbi:hypothetical protein K466DRAFT_591471 [Polyporus arcularius HHB13444]|uniref:Uncharacterized protein n=2 Tax=Polyporaceae TaxID=5317 RepID=A0A5C3NYH7_9APHY|nr:hypothetical protein OH76DRAFT_1408795 [Polyporus brumalis]TFK81080.1 hypothetical protein K466DRAFT_591471 [Polyporus arcularius HHB13444]
MSAGSALLAIPKSIGKGYLYVVAGTIAGASKVSRGLGKAVAILCCPCTCGMSLMIAAEE